MTTARITRWETPRASSTATWTASSARISCKRQETGARPPKGQLGWGPPPTDRRGATCPPTLRHRYRTLTDLQIEPAEQLAETPVRTAVPGPGTMIVFEQVRKVYEPDVVALRDVSFVIDKGEFVFVVGASGSGKSTLGKLLLLRRNVGCVFQDFKLLPSRSAAENVAYALKVQGEGRSSIRRKVPEVLGLVGLSHKMGSLPDELSGGEQQRVSIARAFVNHPPLLVCDEPTGNLDPDTSVGIMQLLYRINRAGTTILMVTHDREMVDKMRRRVIALEDGRLARDERRGGYES